MSHTSDACSFFFLVISHRYERIVEAFLKLDLDTDDLQGFLKNVVLKTVQNTEENILHPGPKYDEVYKVGYIVF